MRRLYIGLLTHAAVFGCAVLITSKAMAPPPVLRRCSRRIKVSPKSMAGWLRAAFRRPDALWAVSHSDQVKQVPRGVGKPPTIRSMGGESSAQLQ